MTTDDLDYGRSRTSKLADEVKKFIDELKALNDVLPFVAKIAAFIGGALLVCYAAKEHFFYDVSSIAAISLLFITFFAFSLIFLVLVIYSFVSTLWIVVGFYHVMRLDRTSHTSARSPPASTSYHTGTSGVLIGRIFMDGSTPLWKTGNLLANDRIHGLDRLCDGLFRYNLPAAGRKR
ncbi:MAG: hypothetical protein WCA23_01220 [Stellaceae bacterium]